MEFKTPEPYRKVLSEISPLLRTIRICIDG